MRDFTDDLLKRMGILKMNNAMLAQAAGVSPAYITKVLRGSENFTVETMSKLAMAVGGKVRIHIADQKAQTYWADTSGTVASSSGPATQALSVFSVGENHQIVAAGTIRSLPGTTTEARTT
jgi:plasmid maintenance system antidote protein VapI